MTFKKIAGSVAAGVIAVGIAAVPMTAQAAPAGTAVSSGHASAASSAVADRKKKKIKISLGVQKLPDGAIPSVRVHKGATPIAGAPVVLQFFSGRRWVTLGTGVTDANGGFTFGGVCASIGNPKWHVKSHKHVSRTFRTPHC